MREPITYRVTWDVAKRFVQNTWTHITIVGDSSGHIEVVKLRKPKVWIPRRDR